jgi:hypothetical protein
MVTICTSHGHTEDNGHYGRFTLEAHPGQGAVTMASEVCRTIEHWLYAHKTDIVMP